MKGRKFGDRRDARRVKLPALMQCCIDLKPERCHNEVYINEKMDVTNLVKYIEDKKAQGIHYTYFQAFMTAIGKVIYNRPKLNYFITNRHLYEHNEVSLAFVAKISLNDSSEELMLIVKIEPEDTIETISAKLNAKVEKLRNKSMEKKGSNNAIDYLGVLPNAIRVPIFGLIKWLDKHGWLPKVLTDDNIYFSSMIISNLGSIGCGAIYHNISDFGTSSGLTTMGKITTEEVFAEDGSKEIKKFCEFGITLDERIGDGFYFANSAKMIEYILMNPELLEEPASSKVNMK